MENENERRFEMKLSKAEKEARAKYLREWRAKNKEKGKQNSPLLPMYHLYRLQKRI